MNPYLPVSLLALLAIPALADEPSQKVATPQLGGFLRLGLVDAGELYELRDASSRIGLRWQQPLSADWQALAALEVGINVTGSEPAFTVSGGDGFAPAGSGDDVFWARLGFIGAESERWGKLTAGKQWGSYYDVTGSTDMLEYFGGEASGTYNFRSDGGASGTGRADKAIQYQLQLGTLHLSLQHQAVESEIDLSALDLPTTMTATYGRGEGISLLWQPGAKIGIGAAWNQSEIALQDAGTLLLSTQDTATAATFFFGDANEPGLYAALVWYQGENHEIDDAGTVFDSEGGEYYLQWMFVEGGQLYLAGNQLEPRHDETLYRLDYTALGFRQTIAGTLMWFVEYKMEQSKSAAGEPISDAMIVGAKYSF